MSDGKNLDLSEREQLRETANDMAHRGVGVEAIVEAVHGIKGAIVAGASPKEQLFGLDPLRDAQGQRIGDHAMTDDLFSHD